MALGWYLTPNLPPFWLLAGADVFLLGISILWAWHRIDPDLCLRMLKPGHPRLSETLRTQLELDESEATSRPDSSPFLYSADQYFRNRHLDDVSALIRDTLPLRTGWRSAAVAAGLVQLLLGGLIWWKVHDGQNLVMFPQNSPLKTQSIRILFPAYLRKPPHQLETIPKRLNTPLGARLEMYWVEKPGFFKSIKFISGSEEIPVEWNKQGIGWVASLTPAASGTLNFDRETNSIEWEVIPDQMPKLRVNWTEMPHVFDDSKLPVEIYAEDDHALHQIVLRYRVERQARSFQEILQWYEEPFKVYRESYEWDLSGTPLRAGDTVRVWVEASDRDTLNGPHVNASVPHEFQVESRRTFHSAVLRQFELLNREMRDLMELLDLQALPDTSRRENRMLAELDRLKRDVVHDALLTPQLQQFPRELYAQLLWFQREREKSAVRE